ncbi:endonuclease domain-containing 1 protein [Dasypus novemcinctus]|uniref:endonuclease domain-containing 1 protein n=1 Tax=Dasypus novemcinctus TaxID=9361 RepID=UPI00265EC900|nr:endonuclease domain-containing 1 protein [Dasypus novemcinctus]
MGPARWLALGGLLALAARPEGRVVRDDEAGFGECGRFFHAGRPPAGLDAEPRVKLCQRAGGAERFATLYSPRLRGPLYSAFRAARPAPRGRPQRWLVEPQIDDPSSSLDEAVDEDAALASVRGLGGRQALSADFLGSKYEAGQLYPFSLGSDPQEAAFTLTNAAPMPQAFRERWHGSLGSLVERALAPQCGGGEDLYMLAGAVPSGRSLGDRVAVPEFVWLAACCAVPGGWAMGFVEHPREGAVLEDVMVRELEKLLPYDVQLFQDNCGEAQQDTEKMQKILEVVNQIQAEERALLPGAPPGPLPSVGRRGGPPPEAPAEGRGLLERLAGAVAAPVVRLLQLACRLAVGLLQAVGYLLWWAAQQLASGLGSGLHRLGAAGISYLLAIGEELVGVPWKALKVMARVLRAVLRILCCLLKATCRVLSLPVHVLVDVAAFPVHTVGAIPAVCRDVAAGLGGAAALLLDATLGTVAGLLQVVFGVCQRIGYKVAFDNSGEF